MPTNQVMADKSLQALGYLGKGIAADATDAATYLDVLNAMLATWAEQDIDLNWFPQDTLSDTYPLGRETELAVIYNSAIECSVAFDVVPSNQLVDKADEHKRALANRVMNDNLEPADMRHMSQGYPYWGDIINGP